MEITIKLDITGNEQLARLIRDAITEAAERVLSEGMPRRELRSDEKMMLSVKEAATLLGISRQQIYELIHQKKMHSLKLGERRIGIPRSAIDEWLANREVAEAAPSSASPAAPAPPRPPAPRPGRKARQPVTPRRGPRTPAPDPKPVWDNPNRPEWLRVESVKMQARPTR